MKLKEEGATFYVEVLSELKSIYNQQTGDYFKVSRMGFRGKIKGKYGILSVHDKRIFLKVGESKIGIPTFSISNMPINYTSTELMPGVYLSYRLLTNSELSAYIDNLQKGSTNIEIADVTPLIIWTISNGLSDKKMEAIASRLQSDSIGEIIAAKVAYIRFVKRKLNELNK